jgi:hypothetical protein
MAREIGLCLDTDIMPWWLGLDVKGDRPYQFPTAMRSFFDVSIVDRVAALVHVGWVASSIVGAIRESPLRGVSVKTKIPCR